MELQRIKEEQKEKLKMQQEIFNNAGGFEDNHSNEGNQE